MNTSRGLKKGLAVKISTMDERLGNARGNKGIYEWNSDTEKAFNETPDVEGTILGGKIIIFFKSKKAREAFEKIIPPITRPKNPDVPVFKEKI